MERFLVLIVICCFPVLLIALPPLETVKYVDLDSYVGRWYQIAFSPTRFQSADCGEVVTADYGIDNKGRITVHNICWDDLEMTEVSSEITGTARVASDNNAKIKVRFFWWLPFSANYWIINLDEENYQYAVVSEPKRRYLWIIAREYGMNRELYETIIADLEARGFDLSRLAVTAPIY